MAIAPSISLEDRVRIELGIARTFLKVSKKAIVRMLNVRASNPELAPIINPVLLTVKQQIIDLYNDYKDMS